MELLKTDIEIAQSVEMEPITKIAEKAGIDEEYLEQYGKYKAKIDYKILEDMKDKADGKLILVTAISPTPAERAFAGTCIRYQGRSGRRRLRSARSDGRHQPALHRRYARNRRGEQSDRGDARQSYPAGQQPQHRSETDHMEALSGYERSCVA